MDEISVNKNGSKLRLDDDPTSKYPVPGLREKFPHG
ncbi:hypothetical protein SRRS_48030 [Sporomusa rhizae]